MQTMTPEPIVRSYEPSAAFERLTRAGNVIMRPLLRSRLGRRIDDLALLTFTGRKSGRGYTIPVAYHVLDGNGVVLTSHAWKANLRGGADVEVVHHGERIPMRAEVVEDPREVARIYGALLRRVGPAKAKLSVGLQLAGKRLPTDEEIEEAIGGRRVAVLLRRR
jgi:F420H(2)-dependent quinone reductase